MADIAIIPARGGSKGLPGKNRLLLAGKPLIVHSIEAARASGVMDKIAVTSDDEEILAIAAGQGVLTIRRPEVLATDTASSFDAVAHALDTLGASAQDRITLLQPTSPLRNGRHVAEAHALFSRAPNALSLFSVTEEAHHPYKSFLLGKEGTLQPLKGEEFLARPRQQLPSVYRQNGAIYIVGVADLLARKSFFIPPCLPYVMAENISVDIDTAEDMRRAEEYLARGNEP